MSDQLRSLLDRVEKAEGPDRELDTRVALALGFAHEAIGPGQHAWRAPWDEYPRPLPEFTASLDAALALVERVRPGCFPGVAKRERLDRSTSWDGWLSWKTTKPESAKAYGGEGRSPALALLAALLRSLSEAEVSHE